MNDTYVTVIGNVASEIRFTTTDGGIAVASFRVASTPRRFTQGNWTDGHTSYVTVKCWRGLADNVHTALAKGQPVVVHGRQTVRPWERDDGRTGTSVDIDADAVGHDLRWGITKFTKTTRSAETRDPSDSAARDLARSFDADDIDGADTDRGGAGSDAGSGGEPPSFTGASTARGHDDGWAVPGAGGASAAA